MIIYKHQLWRNKEQLVAYDKWQISDVIHTHHKHLQYNGNCIKMNRLGVSEMNEMINTLVG